MKDVLPQLIITIVPMFFSGFSAYLFARLKEKDAVEKEATEEAEPEEEVIAEARKYDNNHEFRMNSPKAYDYARKHGIMEKCREHMNKK